MAPPALVVSVQALELEPGDEVLTSPFTFVATLNAILRAGATARFGYFQDSSISNGVEDCADVSAFSNGAVATLSASRASQRKVRTLSLLERDQLVKIDLLRRDITVYRHIAQSALGTVGYRAPTVVDIPMVLHGAEPLAAQLGHFLALLQQRHGSPDVETERLGILPSHRVVQMAADMQDTVLNGYTEPVGVRGK